MAATFWIRPWQQRLPSLRSSPCRPLGATPSRWVAAQNGLAAPARTPGHDRMTSDMGQRRRMNQLLKKSLNEGSAPSLEGRQKIVKEIARSPKNMAMLTPMTIVGLPLRELPRQPRDFLWYQWQRYKTHARDWGQVMLQVFSTMPGWFKRPRIKVDREDIRSAAKYLHQSLWTSMAKGHEGKKTLEKICCPQMYNKLVRTIENRPKNKRLEFLMPEQTRLLDRWGFGPRIMDHKWGAQENPGAGVSHFRQAVVRISTKQRLLEKDETGKVIRETQQELDEYLILWRNVDMKELQQGEWHLLGTMKPTTLKGLEDELKLMDTLGETETERVRGKFKKESGHKRVKA